MVKKIDRRVRYTKMVLRESLSALLKDESIEKITVKRICEHADINRGTFYSHYSDQFDLYNNIVDELIEGIFERLGNFMTVPEEELVKSIVNTFEYIKENGELITTLINKGVEYNVEKRIRNIVEEIYLSKNDDVDMDYLNCAYSFIAAGSISLIRQWLNSDMSKSAEEMAFFSRQLISRGFSSLF